MSIKISEMAEAESLNDNDLLTIVQDGINKKITKQNAIGDIIQAINNPTYTTTEGTDLSIDNTRVGKMKFEYYGNTEQNGEPTPDNPVEVKTVTGENEIQICGKNLFDYSKVRVRSIYSFATTNFLSGGADNTSVSINNQNVLSGTASPYVAVGIPFKFEANKTIYNNAYVGERSLLIYDKNGNVVAHISPPTTSYTPNQTFDGYLGVGIKSAVNVTGEKVMFSYENNANFETYQSQSYEINLGTKNSFDKNNINLLDGYYVDGTGKVVAGSNNKFNWVKLNQNTTYTLKQTIVSNVTRRIALYNSQPVANSTGTIIGSFTGTEIIDLTFNTNANSYIGWVYCNTSNLNGHTQQEMIDSIILAKGTTLDLITNNPIELCKIGDLQDYIYTNGGKWFKHKEIGKVLLNGTEPWALNSSSGDSYKYWLVSTNFKNVFNNCLVGGESLQLGKLMCDYFIQSIFSQTAIGKFSINNDSGSQWFLLNSPETSIDNFKTWLSTHNVSVYYALATPIEEEITETTLTNQLNAIKYGAESYYGQTNITITSEELQPNLKVQTLEKIGE